MVSFRRLQMTGILLGEKKGQMCLGYLTVSVCLFVCLFIREENGVRK